MLTKRLTKLDSVSLYLSNYNLNLYKPWGGVNVGLCLIKIQTLRWSYGNSFNMTPLGRKYTLRTSMTWKSYSVVFLGRIKIINLNNKILAVKNFYDSRWTYLVSTYWIKSFKFPSFLETVFNYIFLVLWKEKLICFENVIKTSLPQLN